MAAKKKKKAASKKKAVKAGKKKAPARKAKRTAAKKTSKAKKKTAKKSKKSVKAAARKAPARKAKKSPARKKQIVGEGDYAASRSFLKDQSDFVEKNRSNIPAMGKDAEKALEGPEGDSLRDAEATAAARSRDNF